MSPTATPGQTIGPFYGYALPFPDGDRLVPLGHPDAVRLHGHVHDGQGNPVPDALLEIWQADASGRVVQETGSLKRDGYTFTGWGRAATDDTGHYEPEQVGLQLGVTCLNKPLHFPDVIDAVEAQCGPGRPSEVRETLRGSLTRPDEQLD